MTSALLAQCVEAANTPDDRRCYAIFVPDDDEPDGERYIGLVYGTEAAKRKCELATSQGICLIVRPYEAMVNQ